MYKRCGVRSQPKRSTQRLWRYVSEDHLIDLLTTEELYFRQVSAFDDALEGLLTIRAREFLFRWYLETGETPAIAQKSVEEYESTRHIFYANCWHMADHEAYLMWKVYGGRGYAIRTTVEMIEAAFDRFSGEIIGGTVDYVDFNAARPEIGNTLNLVSTKDLPYRDEREFRLLFPDWHSAPVPDPRPPGRRIPVELRFLIDTIYVHPILGQPSPKVAELLKLRGLSWTSSVVVEKPRAVAEA